MRVIVVTVEGVLRKLTDGSRITEGVELLHKLTADTGYSGLIFLTSKPAAETEEWLDLEGISRDLVLGAREDRAVQLRRIQHEWGYPIQMVIESDPAVAAELMREGYTTLLFLHPAYSKPEWRPDHEFAVTPWDLIRAQASSFAHLRETDTRLKGD